MKGAEYYETFLFMQRSVPPRGTLVPRILAALTAGAVTLGALPYASADPIVTPTVTADAVAPDGVAGSIDGSAATITVGTEGGGAIPKIYNGSVILRPVYGSWYQSAAPGTNITITGSRAIIHSGKMGNVYGNYAKLTAGGTAHIENAQVQITGGTVNGSVRGGKANVSGGTDAAAEASKNSVTITGGTFDAARKLYGGYAEAQSTDANATAKANSNRLAFTTGAEVSELYGGRADAKADGIVTVEANDNELTAKAKADFLAGGYVFGQETPGGAAVQRSTAAANRNRVKVLEGSGEFASACYGGDSFLVAYNTKELLTEAVANEVTIQSDTFKNTLSGGRTNAVNMNTVADSSAAVKAEGNRVTATAGKFNELYGGDAHARTKAGAAYAAARGNVLDLRGGTYGYIFGGSASAGTNTGTTEAIAENNEIYISGGTYLQKIWAGGADVKTGSGAIIRNNKIEITGTPDLSAARLYGAFTNGPALTIADNALVVKDTKNITAAGIEKFQKLAFWIPDGMTESDTMLKVTDGADTDLKGTAIEAHLPPSPAVTAKRLRLLHTPNAQILTDDTTTMSSAVWEGISGFTPGIMGLTADKKELIVERGAFQLNEDNAKSLAETITGSAAFLGSGLNFSTNAGMASASAEAATAKGFALFAAIGGSSMHHETGSHVDLKGMNLAVGFAREVKSGDDRLLFGPIIEYGRGNYDSYVNDARGDGAVRYVGGGLFLRQEQKSGLFYEGSLRFGRSSMDYTADLTTGAIATHTSYDTDANYFGAHLGIGQRVEQKDGNDCEFYLRYFYTRQGSSDATLSTGDHYTFSAVNSNRLRTGARRTIPQSGGALIVGASMQYEFGGDASATYHRPGGFSYTSASPSLKGFSASVELGWKASIGENASANISVEGWAGKQRGVTLNAGFNRAF